MDINSLAPINGRILAEDGSVVNLVDLLNPDAEASASGGEHDINTYTPRFGNIIGEDGRVYNLLDVLKNLTHLSQLATKPHLWETDVEYDFGDGTFGRRFIETNWIASTITSCLMEFMGNDVKIIGYGGYVQFDTFPYNAHEGRIPVGQAFTKGITRASSALFTEFPGEIAYHLYLHTDTSSTSNSAYKYDVWVRYTK